MEPNDTLIKCMKQIWEEEGIFIVLFNIDRLQYNILEHDYVPKHVVIEEEEVNMIKAGIIDPVLVTKLLWL